MIESKNYLTINQLAKICSTSRSTLLRMEKDGILDPVYIAPESGYRYYDESCVLRVCRNLSLQELGITHRELYNYYENENNYQTLLNVLEAKISALEHHIAEIKLQLHRDESLKISYYKFPGVSCYTKLLKNVTDLSIVRPNIWNLLSEVIERGYALNKDVNPFVVVDYKEIVESGYRNLGYNYEICIPILGNNENERIKFFEPVESVSTIIYGGAADMQKAFQTLTEEMKKNNLIASEKARVATVVSSVPGEDIPLEYWVERVCVPYTKK